MKSPTSAVTDEAVRREVDSLLRAGREEPPPPGAEKRVRERVRLAAATTKTPWWRARASLFAGIGLVAITAALLLRASPRGTERLPAPSDRGAAAAVAPMPSSSPSRSAPSAATPSPRAEPGRVNHRPRATEHRTGETATIAAPHPAAAPVAETPGSDGSDGDPTGTPASREAALVYSATRALRVEHDAARSRALLEDYQSRYPNGVYLDEVLFLAIEANDGDPQRAREAARRYLARFPSGRYADRARQLVVSP